MRLSVVFREPIGVPMRSTDHLVCEPCGTTHPPLTNHTTLLTNTTQVAESFGITAQEATLGLGCVPIPRGPDRPTKRPDRWRQLFVPTCLLRFYGTHIRELASAHHPSAFQARLTLPHPPLNPSTHQTVRQANKAFLPPRWPEQASFLLPIERRRRRRPQKIDAHRRRHHRARSRRGRALSVTDDHEERGHCGKRVRAGYHVRFD